MKFIDDLNLFLEKIISEWYESSGSLIGVSIQVLHKLQDDNAVTRNILNSHTKGSSTSRSLVNKYCTKVIKTKERICDDLDYSLKTYLDRSDLVNKVICKCHGGVSNILIKHHYKNFERTFYIFIGQFLLKDIVNKNIKKNFLIQSGIENLNEMAAYSFVEPARGAIMEGGFFDDKYRTELSANSDMEGKDNISLVSAGEYLLFENYLLSEFDNFLKNYFKKDKENDRLIPDDNLKEYLEHIDVNNLIRELKDCKNSQSIEFPIQTIVLIDQIVGEINRMKGNISQTILNNINELLSVGVGTGLFIDKATNIVNILKQIK